MESVVTTFGARSIDMTAYDTPVPKPNYEPYDLFCIGTKLSPKIAQYKKGWTISYGKKEISGFVHVTIGVLHKAKAVNLTSQEHDDVLAMFNSSIQEYPNMCLLLHDKTRIMYDGVCLNPEWISAIIKSSKGSDGTGSIYVELDAASNYRDEYNTMYNKVLKNITNLYKMGSIRLDPSIDKEFIDRWELVPSTSYSNIYHPSWSNVFVTSSPTRFLEEMYVGLSYVEFKLKPTLNERHHVSRVLNVQYKDETILVEVNSYRDCVVYYNMILESMITANGTIITDILPSNYKEVVDYKHMKYGHVRSYKV